MSGVRTLQKFAAVDASLLSRFDMDRHRATSKNDRSVALAEWREAAS